MKFSSSGFKTWQLGDYRIQIYYPAFYFKNKEIFIKIDTVVRIIFPQFRHKIKVYGFGVTILGFGAGFDYEEGYYEKYIKPLKTGELQDR